MNALNMFEICERRGRCEMRGTSKGTRIRGINGKSAGNSAKKQSKAAESRGKRIGSCEVVKVVSGTEDVKAVTSCETQ